MWRFDFLTALPFICMILLDSCTSSCVTSLSSSGWFLMYFLLFSHCRRSLYVHVSKLSITSFGQFIGICNHVSNSSLLLMWVYVVCSTCFPIYVFKWSYLNRLCHSNRIWMPILVIMAVTLLKQHPAYC